MPRLHRIVTRLAIGLSLLSTAALAEGLPQMESKWFGNQLLWLGLCFTLLYWLVAARIVPGVGRVLDERAQTITRAIAEAEEARRSGEHARGDAHNAHQQARTQATELMAHAQSQASAETQEAIAKLSRDLSRKIEQAEARIAAAKEQAAATLAQETDALAASMMQALLAPRKAL